MPGRDVQRQGTSPIDVCRSVAGKAARCSVQIVAESLAQVRHSWFWGPHKAWSSSVIVPRVIIARGTPITSDTASSVPVCEGKVRRDLMPWFFRPRLVWAERQALGEAGRFHAAGWNSRWMQSSFFANLFRHQRHHPACGRYGGEPSTLHCTFHDCNITEMQGYNTRWAAQHTEVWCCVPVKPAPSEPHGMEAQDIPLPVGGGFYATRRHPSEVHVEQVPSTVRRRAHQSCPRINHFQKIFGTPPDS